MIQDGIQLCFDTLSENSLGFLQGQDYFFVNVNTNTLQDGIESLRVYAVNCVLTLLRISQRDTSAVTTPYTRWKMKLPPANMRFDKSVGASTSATGT